MKEKFRVLISGRVQGVFFRATAREEAKRLQLDGFARNLPDGRVEIVGEGERAALEEMIRWCRKGPRGAMVESVEIEWGKAEGQWNGFWVK